MAQGKFNVGHVLVPWPFLLFGALALAGGFVFPRFLGPARGMMLAFDVAAVVFCACCVHLFHYEADDMRAAAQRNDANRVVMLLIATGVVGVIMVAVATELAHKGRPQPFDLSLILATLVLCWIFSTLLYTLHYAHLYYMRGPDGKDARGLTFPETPEPDYWDFAYFSSCLAMTFQTSDVDIPSGAVRRAVMFHSLGAFVFNLGVVAFSINILGGS